MYVASVVLWRSLAVAIALLATACTGDDPPPDHADTHPEETAVAPTSAAAPTATPTTAALGEQVNTVEAAQRLLDLFAKLDGDAARLLLQKGTPDAEFDQALQAVYVNPELDLARGRFAREASLKLFGYARPQPDVLFRATRMVDSRRNDCAVLMGTADLRPRYTNPVPVVSGAFVLVDQTGVTPSGGNPTSWRILRFGEQEPGSDLQAICPAL